MKQHNSYLFLVLIAGVCGAVLRGMSLLYGYESESGLPVGGYLPSTALLVLAIALVVVAAVLCRTWFGGQEYAYEQLFAPLSGVGRVLCMLFGIGMAIVSVLGLIYLPGQLLEESTIMGDQLIAPSMIIVVATAVTWALGLITGIGLLLLAMGSNKPVSKKTGFYTTIPMFWGCLDLIMVYHDNSANPVLSDYTYQLVLIVAVMLAFYSMSGFLFSKGSAPRFFVSAGAAIFLAITNAGGLLVWKLRANSDLGIMGYFGISVTFRAVMYLLAGAYLLAVLSRALHITPLPPKQEKTEETSTPQATEA